MTTNDQTNKNPITSIQADDDIIPINSIGLKSLKKRKMVVKENSISIEDHKDNESLTARTGLIVPQLP